MLFIDHMVFERLSARWIHPYTFEQLIYPEPYVFIKQLFDHCPIAVSIQVPGDARRPEQMAFTP
jgi:hypothetical protein